MNISQVIVHLYPQAIPMKDFIVQDDSDGNGAYIAQWNLEADQPTQEQLQAAWEAILELPLAPEPETDAEKIARLEAENAALIDRVTATEDSIVTLMDTVLMLMI